MLPHRAHCVYTGRKFPVDAGMIALFKWTAAVSKTSRRRTLVIAPLIRFRVSSMPHFDGWSSIQRWSVLLGKNFGLWTSDFKL